MRMRRCPQCEKLVQVVEEKDGSDTCNICGTDVSGERNGKTPFLLMS